jgi:hypothetical protein
LGFVALKPTYILPVLLRIAKPNNGRFRNRAAKVSISIKLAVFLASGWAYMKKQSFFYDQTGRSRPDAGLTPETKHLKSNYHHKARGDRLNLSL